MIFSPKIDLNLTRTSQNHRGDGSLFGRALAVVIDGPGLRDGFVLHLSVGENWDFSFVLKEKVPETLNERSNLVFTQPRYFRETVSTFFNVKLINILINWLIVVICFLMSEKRDDHCFWVWLAVLLAFGRMITLYLERLSTLLTDTKADLGCF